METKKKRGRPAKDKPVTEKKKQGRPATGTTQEHKHLPFAIAAEYCVLIQTHIS
jgi:hypothetical protein